MTSRRPFLNGGDAAAADDDDDSRGTRLYTILGLSRSATPAEVKAAFRAAARRLHPDRLLTPSTAAAAAEEKTAAASDETASTSSPASSSASSSSSSGAAFAAAREAFLVLSDPVRRAAYDASGTGGRSWYSRGGGGGMSAFWPGEEAAAAAKKEKKPTAAKTSPFPSSTSSFPHASAAAADAAAAAASAAQRRAHYERASSEAALLLAGLTRHLRCDPRTQLVLTCALCSRPAGVSCSVCLLPLCALCCRRRHARAPGDSVGGRLFAFSVGGNGSGSGCDRSSSSSSSASPLAFRPHWPLVGTPGAMSRRLAARELEAKRLADAAMADAVLPHARGRQELEDVRELRERYVTAAREKEEEDDDDAEGATLDAAGAGVEEKRGREKLRSSSSSSSRTTYDPFLSRFYAWDQTPCHVVVAVRLPTGDADRGLRVEVAESGGDNDEGEEWAFSSSRFPSSSSSSRPTHRLFVAADGAPPVIDRVLSRAIAAAAAAARGDLATSSPPPLVVRRSADKRSLLLTITKAVPGEQWPRLFCGDSFRSRCVDPPYSVREGSSSVGGTGRRRAEGRGGESDDADDENNVAPSAAADGAVVEVELCPELLPLPSWVQKGHIAVETTREKLSVRVQGVFELERYFWDPTGRAVLPSETAWSLEKKNQKEKSCGESESGGKKGSEETKGAGKAKTTTATSSTSSSSSSTLTITLVRPSSSPSNDNRPAPRPDGRPPGRRFFACDDDFYGLEDSVAAGVLSLSSTLEESSSSFVPVGAAVRAPPWRPVAAAADEGRPRRVRDAACLPVGAQRQLAALLEEEEGGEGESSSDDEF